MCSAKKKAGPKNGTGFNLRASIRLYIRLRPRSKNAIIIIVEGVAIIAKYYLRHDHFLLPLHKYVKRFLKEIYLTKAMNSGHSPPHGRQ